MKKYGKGGDSVAQEEENARFQEKYESSMKTCVQGIWQWWDS